MTPPSLAHGSRIRDASRRTLLLGAASVAVTRVLVGCGGGAELFVPFFVFNFAGDIGTDNVSMTFGPDAASRCKAQGQFAGGGASFINVFTANGTVSSGFTGMFNGRELNIVLDTPQDPLAAQYDGHFTDDPTLVLTPVGGGATITVVRNGARDESLCPK